MLVLVAFGIILDDLVFPDGRTALGVLGGGGPQTAFGLRLPALAGWTSIPYTAGLVSGIGPDFPDGAGDWLAAAGIDRQGLRENAVPTARAWQVLEDDGRRGQIFRVPGPVVGAQLGRALDRIPFAYRRARGFHLGIHPDEPDLDSIAQLRALEDDAGHRPLISLEPFKPADRPLADPALRRLCSAADIFSPNLFEAYSLVGEAEPDQLARRLLDAGALTVALRLGAEGALVCTGADAGMHVVQTPAIPVSAVDATGAGNAFCGGLLVGLALTGNLTTAARYGTVAASFLVEQVGLPPITPDLPAQAQERLAWLDEHD